MAAAEVFLILMTFAFATLDLFGLLGNLMDTKANMRLRIVMGWFAGASTHRFYVRHYIRSARDSCKNPKR